MAKRQVKRRGAGEGCVIQRKDGRWCAVVTTGYENGKQQRKFYYGLKREDVQKQLVEALGKQLQGEVIPTGKKTLGEFLDKWLADCVKPLAPNTYSGYETQIRVHIKPALGNILLRKLTGQQVQRFLNSLADKASKNVKEKKLSARTVAYNRTILRKALNQAVDWREIPHNPAANGIKTARIEKRKIEAVTPEEAQAILKAVSGHRLTALLTLYLFTGLRRGEALGLRWSDVDLDRAKLRVNAQLQRLNKRLVIVENPKTEDSRRKLTIPSPALSLLREWRGQQLLDRMLLGPDWTDLGLVFTTQMGTPIDPRNVKRVLDRLLRKAGIAHKRIHDLRHACATLLFEAGEDVKMISEILGHSSTKTTENIYIHISEAAQARAMDRLAALVGGAK